MIKSNQCNFRRFIGNIYQSISAIASSNSSDSPAGLVDTIIAGLQHCLEKQVGPSAMAALKDCGDEKG
jgi:hypothetical protein